MTHLVVVFCLLSVAFAGPPAAKTRVEIEDFKEALEKSREDDGLTLEKRMEMYPLQNEWANSGKFQGDILLDDQQIEEFIEGFSSGRMAYTRAGSRWPDNTAVYEFGPGEFNIEQQRHILNIMNILADRTCIRFRHRNANDRNFVRITGRPTGCYAHVGFHAPRQITTLNIARNRPGYGCLNFVIIAHEWYHVLGFFHMQSTYTRDHYVRIHWENIRQGYAHAFYRFDLTSNLRLPYEYGSCMHYGTHFFTVNGRPTISTTRPYNGVLGQTIRITGWDIWRLGRHYNCPGAWSTEAMDKARTTALVQNEKGEIVEEKTESPIADELELLEDVEVVEE